MAMMMTGRVLLVCALCVLWCSASVVLSAAGVFTSDRSDTEENMVIFWHNAFNRTCKDKSTTEGKLNRAAFKSCMHESMREVCSSDDDELSSASRDPAAEEICNKYTGDPEEDVESSTPQEKPSPDAEKLVAATTPETPKVESAEMGSPPGVPADDSPGSPTEGSQSTLAANDTANNETEKGITEVMPKNAPEFKVTRKEEEKQHEKNHNSAKEKPLDADAMKNITTTGDSDGDGSTAVSHTTSPLLLLLLVVAAAAVAVAA
ncbi:mucin-associated surface protein [Trypanosoma cruzi cruzi]|uniref:Mucin-associated surface protein (MASP) n=1 Tax=Trypanosoma cruzi TaxID=5693 RepID=A0A2V2W9C4_TRYCR|nr:mucin-associated surface protein [Trypanosoma cruzi cruzi]PWV03164.1 Mucin-associated surface protein (MASP) [Trypanosoma cruzi]